jgi:hypothetical protein
MRHNPLKDNHERAVSKSGALSFGLERKQRGQTLSIVAQSLLIQFKMIVVMKLLEAATPEDGELVFLALMRELDVKERRESRHTIFIDLEEIKRFGTGLSILHPVMRALREMRPSFAIEIGLLLLHLVSEAPGDMEIRVLSFLLAKEALQVRVRLLELGFAERADRIIGVMERHALPF